MQENESFRNNKLIFHFHNNVCNYIRVDGKVLQTSDNEKTSTKYFSFHERILIPLNNDLRIGNWLALPFRLLSQQKFDPTISVSLTVSHFRINNRKACCENNFKNLFPGWHFKGRVNVTPRERDERKIKISFININITSIIIYHFVRPCHVHYVSLEEEILDVRLTFHSLPLVVVDVTLLE